MKKVLLTFLLILIFSIIYYGFEFREKSYFEGQIIYDIEYSTYKIDPQKLKELNGSKIILTYKKGNYKKQYFSPNGKLVQERILDLEAKKSYLKIFDTDTIFWFDITKSDSEISFKILNDSIILDHPCKIIETSFFENNLSEQLNEVKTITKYAQDLIIDPSWYKDFRYSSYNEIAKIVKGISIEETTITGDYEREIKLNSINKRKVNSSELEIELKNNPLVEL